MATTKNPTLIKLDRATAVPQAAHSTPVPTAAESTGGRPKAVKHDSAKSRMDLIPAVPLMQVGAVFGYGAQKYSDNNYLAGDMSYGRVYAAAQRHLNAWWGGEEFDPESGFDHLAHATTCLLMLMQMRHLQAGVNDREVIPVFQK